MKKYYSLIFVIIVVTIIFSSSLGTKLESLSTTVRGVAMLAFIVPTCSLLYLVSKDKKIKRGFRIAAKTGFIFLIICYIGGLIAEFV